MFGKFIRLEPYCDCNRVVVTIAVAMASVIDSNIGDKFEWTADRFNLRLYWWDHPECREDRQMNDGVREPVKDVLDSLPSMPIDRSYATELASYIFEKYTTCSEHVTYRRFVAEVRAFEAAKGKLIESQAMFFAELEQLLAVEHEAEMVQHQANIASWVAADTDDATSITTGF